jgi:hypothetical protein
VEIRDWRSSLHRFVHPLRRRRRSRAEARSAARVAYGRRPGVVRRGGARAAFR